MPSNFDNRFAADASGELMREFGRAITVVKNTVTGQTNTTTTYSPTAQIGKEEIRRVRTNDGIKVMRVRDVIVSTVAITGVVHLPAAVLATLHRATVDGIGYIVAAFNIEPGNLARLTLERSDKADISRPNLKGRR